MDITAIQKHIISSPKKLREVTFLIKKFSPQVAVDRLPFTGKRAALELKKVVMTAIANAKQVGLNPDDLMFKEIQINEGPRLKRFRAGSRGRAKPYKKKMSHIRIVLTTKPVISATPVKGGKTETVEDASLVSKKPSKKMEKEKEVKVIKK